MNQDSVRKFRNYFDLGLVVIIAILLLLRQCGDVNPNSDHLIKGKDVTTTITTHDTITLVVLIFLILFNIYNNIYTSVGSLR